MQHAEQGICLPFVIISSAKCLFNAGPPADVFCRRKEVECRCQLFLMERLTDENLKACGKTRFPNAAIDALRDGHGPGTLIRLAGIFAKYGLLWRF